MFYYTVKFLTNDESQHLRNNDFKSYRYETKKKVEESVYDVGKRSYYERRGGNWRAGKPRQMKQLESKFRDHSVVLCEWVNESLVTVVFSSGAIAYLSIKPDTLDVTQILFDRYCIGKLSGQTITGVVFSKSHLVFTHIDRMATIVTFGKNSNSPQPCRIADREPHIQNVEMGGGARRGDRKVSWCQTSTALRVLMWSATVAEPAPWSPLIQDHANLHLYQITGQQISLIAYHQLENETLSAELSQKHENTVFIVEQIACHKNGVTLEWFQYELSPNDSAVKLSCSRVEVCRAGLPAPARVVRRSSCDSRLLVACLDGSLHVLHHVSGIRHSTKAGFIATDIRWVGDMVLAAEEGGRLQCFDRALSQLHHHTKCIDLSSYLREARRMQILATWSLKSGPLLLASFTGGPLTLLRITHPRLLTAWIRSGRLSNAVELLRAMDWNLEGSECMWALNRVVLAALRADTRNAISKEGNASNIQSGCDVTSGESLAQAALGSYLAPHCPHTRRFAPMVHDLARKFFHHLLRRGRIEKALSLGVDLAAWDLFSDARWAATRLRMHSLADEAAALAQHYNNLQIQESECSDSCSQCSSHSFCSESEISASSEPTKTKPPPLPRIPVPQPQPQPTIMPVPIAQAEPIQTNSIRPNLHQYLEKDNTLWGTEIKDAYIKHKRILTNQNAKWRGDVNKQSTSKLVTISEVPKFRSVIDVIPRPQDERITASHFRHLFQAELREETPSTVYRYYNNNYHPSASEKMYNADRNVNREKNKVKFSDTVTIAVMPETPRSCPEPARELAESLPLCAPHKYLANFAPGPPPAGPRPQGPSSRPVDPGTTLDYVEV